MHLKCRDSKIPGDLEKPALVVVSAGFAGRTGEQLVNAHQQVQRRDFPPSINARRRFRHSSTVPPSSAASAMAVSVRRPLTANWRPVRRSQASK
jgi:hypothetical protein